LPWRCSLPASENGRGNRHDGSQESHWRDHVLIDPNLHQGDPCIKGTRIPIATIVGGLVDGMTRDEILAAFPQLSKVEIQAALVYAADLLRWELLVPFAG